MKVLFDRRDASAKMRAGEGKGARKGTGCVKQPQGLTWGGCLSRGCLALRARATPG